MLSWVVCWLHGHVVCDGSVMVGKMGGGWLGGMGGGMEWEITHQQPLCPHSLSTMHSSLEVVGVSVVQ